MNTKFASLVAAASLITAGVSSAQSNNMMMNGGGGSFGWMGGYGGIGWPLMLLIAVVGLVAWFAKRGGK